MLQTYRMSRLWRTQGSLAFSPGGGSAEDGNKGCNQAINQSSHTLEVEEEVRETTRERYTRRLRPKRRVRSILPRMRWRPQSDPSTPETMLCSRRRTCCGIRGLRDHNLT